MIHIEQNISFVIIEDEPYAQELILAYCLELQNWKCKGVFGDIASAQAAVESSDIVFLDINLPKLNGIEYLRSQVLQKNVILTTAFSEYAVEGFELNAIDYLLKPISKSRFIQAIKKAEDQLLNQRKSKVEKNTAILFKTGKNLVQIQNSEILFLEAAKDNTLLYLSTKVEPVKVNGHLQEIIEKLESINFQRVHKSFVINKNRILEFNSKIIILEQNYKIPVGKIYRKNIKTLFKS